MELPVKSNLAASPFAAKAGIEGNPAPKNTAAPNEAAKRRRSIFAFSLNASRFADAKTEHKPDFGTAVILFPLALRKIQGESNRKQEAACRIDANTTARQKDDNIVETGTRRADDPSRRFEAHSSLVPTGPECYLLDGYCQSQVLSTSIKSM